MFIEICFVGSLIVLFIFYGISGKPADPMLPETCSENSTNSKSPSTHSNFSPPPPPAQSLKPVNRLEKEMRSLSQSAYSTNHLSAAVNYDEAPPDYYTQDSTPLYTEYYVPASPCLESENTATSTEYTL